jgi:hypothetical protein
VRRRLKRAADAPVYTTGGVPAQLTIAAAKAGGKSQIQVYSFDGAPNQAEEYFSRLRRAEIRIHHHIAGAYLLRYAQESSWGER